jgi:sRNA-binding protein
MNAKHGPEMAPKVFGGCNALESSRRRVSQQQLEDAQRRKMKRRRDTFEADDSTEPSFRSEYRHYRTRKQTKPDVQAIKGTNTTLSL